MAYIEKRGNSYKIRVSCGYDTNGKQVRQSITWKPPENMTARQVEKELQKQSVLFEQQCMQGQVVAVTKFQDYATEYLTKIAPQKLKAGTIANYKNYSKRVFKEVGHIRMDMISPRLVQKFINEMAAGERLDRYRNGALSAKTIKNHIAFLSSVFEYAIRMQIVSSNPCRAVMLPREKVKETKIYSVEETQKILQLLCQEPAKNLHYVLYFMLAVYTGGRRGELCGLEFKDFNFERGTVTFERSSLYTRDKGVYTDSLKTTTSFRSLKLPAEIMDLLKRYRQHQAEHINALGSQWVTQIKGIDDVLCDNDRLFTKWNGEPIFPGSPGLFFGRFCKRTGVTYRKNHSLRHLNASVQILAGVDIKTIQQNLGHSQASTTLNIYAKHFQEVQAASMDKIIGVLGIPKMDVV